MVKLGCFPIYFTDLKLLILKLIFYLHNTVRIKKKKVKNKRKTVKNKLKLKLCKYGLSSYFIPDSISSVKLKSSQKLL